MDDTEHIHWVRNISRQEFKKMLPPLSDRSSSCKLLVAIIEEGRLDLMEILLRHGVDPNWRDFIETNILSVLIICESISPDIKISMMIMLLANKANPDTALIMGRKHTPLVMVINTIKDDDTCTEMIRVLLNNGADPNKIDETKGFTPLTSAIHRSSGNNIDIIRLLLGAGADPNKPDKWGYMPITYVLTTSIMKDSMRIDAIRLLSEFGGGVERSTLVNVIMTPVLGNQARSEILRILLEAVSRPDFELLINTIHSPIIKYDRTGVIDVLVSHIIKTCDKDIGCLVRLYNIPGIKDRVKDVLQSSNIPIADRFARSPVSSTSSILERSQVFILRLPEGDIKESKTEYKLDHILEGLFMKRHQKRSKLLRNVIVIYDIDSHTLHVFYRENASIDHLKIQNVMLPNMFTKEIYPTLVDDFKILHLNPDLPDILKILQKETTSRITPPSLHIPDEIVARSVASDRGSITAGRVVQNMMKNLKDPVTIVIGTFAIIIYLIIIWTKGKEGSHAKKARRAARSQLVEKPLKDVRKDARDTKKTRIQDWKRRERQQNKEEGAASISYTFAIPPSLSISQQKKKLLLSNRSKIVLEEAFRRISIQFESLETYIQELNEEQLKTLVNEMMNPKRSTLLQGRLIIPSYNDMRIRLDDILKETLPLIDLIPSQEKMFIVKSLLDPAMGYIRTMMDTVQKKNWNKRLVEDILRKIYGPEQIHKIKKYILHHATSDRDGDQARRQQFSTSMVQRTKHLVAPSKDPHQQLTVGSRRTVAPGGGASQSKSDSWQQRQRPPQAVASRTLKITSWNIQYEPSQQGQIQDYNEAIFEQLRGFITSSIVTFDIICIQEFPAILKERVQDEILSESSFFMSTQKEIQDATTRKRTITVIIYNSVQFEMIPLTEIAPIVGRQHTRDGGAAAGGGSLTLLAAIQSDPKIRGHQVQGALKNLQYIFLRDKKDEDVVYMISNVHFISQSSDQQKINQNRKNVAFIRRRFNAYLNFYGLQNGKAKRDKLKAMNLIIGDFNMSTTNVKYVLPKDNVLQLIPGPETTLRDRPFIDHALIEKTPNIQIEDMGFSEIPSEDSDHPRLDISISYR